MKAKEGFGVSNRATSFRSMVGGAIISAAVVGAVFAENVQIEVAWSCADWVEAKNNGQIYIQQYLIGTLNGAAVAVAKDVWGLPPRIGPKEAFFWMDVHCQSNPLDTVVQGAFALLQERLGTDWSERPQLND